jgi:hypothetical protein
MKVNESFLFAKEAAADLTGALYKLVKMDNDGNIALAVLGEKALGAVYEVCLQATAPFGPVTVQFAGIAKVIAGGALAAGTRVGPDAASKLVAASTNTTGITIEAAGASGDIVGVALIG